MIEKMHEKSNGPVFKIIFALVSISFVLGGIGGGLMSRDTSAVKVNGEEISQQAFNNAKNRQQNALNNELGERFWDLMDNPVYVAQFHQGVLDQLVDDELLRQYAADLKLGISADQIKSYIVHSPAFQQDGKFDNTLYQNTLRNNALSADAYAAMIHEALLFSQVQEGIINSDFSVPAQQELLAKLMLQKRQVRLATLPIAEQMSKQTASEEELKAFYDAHKANFINPEKMAVEYVVVKPSDLAANIQVTNEQIDTYYQTNKAKYTTKGEARLAHIQVASADEAKAIEQELKNGADFATLAKAKSADKLSATQGGDLGWAKAGVFPAAFEQAANALQAGQVSAPVQIDGSYHIIKVVERKPESIIPVEQLKSQIEQIIRQELVLTDYSNATREMANQAFESNGSLESVAKVANLAVHKTAPFTRDNVPAELNNDKIIRALFDTELGANGQNSEAIDIGDSNNPQTIFVRSVDYKASSNQTFDEAKATVEQAVKLEKASKALLDQAQENVKALEAGEKVSLTFSPEQTLVFAQSQAENPVLGKAVFAMPAPTDKIHYQAVQNSNGDVVIVALNKVINGTLDEFKPFAPQISQADMQVLRHDVLKNLRERAKVELNADFIDGLNNTKQ